MKFKAMIIFESFRNNMSRKDTANSTRNGSFVSSLTDSFDYSDVPRNGTPYNSKNSNLGSSTPPTRPQRPDASPLTRQPSVLESAYQRGSKEAVTVADQIEADILEVRNIIANYAVEPLEMLHLGELTIGGSQMS
jgi:hypothetical protein